MLPVGNEQMQYGSIGVNTIVRNKTGEVSSCGLQYSGKFYEFNRQEEIDNL